MYSQAWDERRGHFDNLFWSKEQGIWADKDKISNQHTSGFYASSTVPLYMWSIADSDSINITRQEVVLQTLNDLGVLDYPGGLPTSLETSEQQWDYPNAWAPLQWFLVRAWFNSSRPALRDAASEVATTWLRSTYSGWLNYNRSMFEKVRGYE